MAHVTVSGLRDTSVDLMYCFKFNKTLYQGALVYTRGGFTQEAL